jgi:SPP1 gp7 family putative phage head morphogenesis protein
VLSRPFQGSLLHEWVAGLEAGRRRRLREAVRIGYTEGETVQQLVRRVRGTAAAGYRDGVLAISRRSAEVVVRTAVAHTATASREVLYEENSDLIKGVEWCSTLDLRTTPVCRARDGKVYPPGSGPRPPAHLQCRSTTVPVVRSWRELGVDTSEAPPGTRASMNGQVAADLTYGEWLRGQSAVAQDEVLGPTKGQLFRAGGLTMDRFVDGTGRAYTLTELRTRERAAWRAAGF